MFYGAVLSFCSHFEEIRHKHQTYYYIGKNMPNNLCNNTEIDIMAIAMKETMIKRDLPLYDFRITELSVNSNTPYKYHFR